MSYAMLFSSFMIFKGSAIVDGPLLKSIVPIVGTNCYCNVIICSVLEINDVLLNYKSNMIVLLL